MLEKLRRLNFGKLVKKAQPMYHAGPTLIKCCLSQIQSNTDRKCNYKLHLKVCLLLYWYRTSSNFTSTSNGIGDETGNDDIDKKCVVSLFSTL